MTKTIHVDNPGFRRLNEYVKGNVRIELLEHTSLFGGIGHRPGDITYWVKRYENEYETDYWIRDFRCSAERRYRREVNRA